MEIIVNYCDQSHRMLPSSLRLVMMSGDWILPTLPERIHLCHLTRWYTLYQW